MAKDVVVTFKDGSIHTYTDVPDEVTPQDVGAQLQKDYGDKAVSSVDPKTSFGHKAAVAGYGVARGLTSTLLGLPSELLNAAGRKNLDYVKNNPNDPNVQRMQESYSATHGGQPINTEERIPKGMEILKAINAQGTQPQNTAEKYINTPAEFIGGAAGPGLLTAPVRGAIVAGGAGLGSEAAGQATNDNPMARLLAAIVSGVVAHKVTGLGSLMAPNTKDIAEEATRGLPPTELTNAVGTMKNAAASGVNVNAAQAVNKDSNLDALVELLANSKYGAPLQNQLRMQPSQVENVTRNYVEKLPGQVLPTGQAANQAAETATSVVDAARKARTSATSPIYKSAGDIGAPELQAVNWQIKQALAQPGLPEQIVNGLRDLQTKLVKNPRTGQPTSSAEDLDALLRDFTGPFKQSPLNPVDPRLSGIASNVAGTLRETLGEVSPEIAAGNKKYAEITKELVNPLKQSITGQVATPKGYAPDVQASIAKLSGVFSKGTNPVAQGKSDILTLAKDLKTQDPEAFPNAAKTWLSDTVANATETSVTGANPSQNIAGAVKSKLFSTDAKRQGLRDIVAGVADNAGVDKTDAVRGLDNYMKIIDMAARLPSKVGGVTTQDMVRIAGASKAATALKFFGLLPFKPVANALEEHFVGKSLNQMSKLLTTPEGLETLAKLGKTDYLSPEAANALTTFTGVVNTTPATQPQ